MIKKEADPVDKLCSAEFINMYPGFWVHSMDAWFSKDFADEQKLKIKRNKFIMSTCKIVNM